jgi:uncharacterized protein (TIGR02284 family)
MNSSTDEVAGILGCLIEVCQSSQQTFQRASQGCRDFEMRAFLDDCSRLRQDMVDDLRMAQRELGSEVADGETDLNGSEWSKSHPVFDGDDHQRLTRCRQAEETAVAEFRQAIELGLPADIATLMRRQLAVIVATCERLRSLEQNATHRRRRVVR